MVVIGDAKENKFVQELAKDNLIWLGGTDEFEEGVWTWDNGEPFKFKNWDANQPSAASGHNFLILNGKNGKWADTTDFSGKVKGYVCEWKGTAAKGKNPNNQHRYSLKSRGNPAFFIVDANIFRSTTRPIANIHLQEFGIEPVPLI